MAIQDRRGAWENFDPTKLLPGEWADVLSGDPSASDGRSVYKCFAAGVVKRMATYEDMEENIDSKTADIIQAAIEALAEEVAHINADALPDMSANQRGIAKLGSGLKVENHALSVDTASTGVIAQSEKAAAGGVAELDANGLIITSQLPSYVDDVVEGATVSDFPAIGETGKIYVATSANLTYRWSGSAYVEISPSLALGETPSTAYRGDRGADAYAHAVTNKGAAFASNLYKITTNSEGHVTAATPATSADIIAFLNNKAITPSSVTASGAIQGSSISDGTGTLAQLRESVSKALSGNTITLYFFGVVTSSSQDIIAYVPFNVTSGATIEIVGDGAASFRYGNGTVSDLALPKNKLNYASYMAFNVLMFRWSLGSSIGATNNSPVVGSLTIPLRISY